MSKIHKDSFGNIIGANGYPLNWDIYDINQGLFSYFKNGIKNTIPYRNITIPMVYKVIIGDYHKKITNNYRRTKAPSLKQQMDYVTFSCVCSKRSERGVISHSNMICIDFDHLDNIEQSRKFLLKETELQTLLLFTSPGGDGLKWIIHIDVSDEHHLSHFVAIRNYMQQQYNLEVDKACKDISRACFIPHDPNCFINTNLFQL
ncbi:BT4734/BF3469 family protein [Sediminitomix flava]|uniref:VirE-like protein n=1 Tax=Sediminitomix flava TaxID=379075 RepID=A0A315ZAC8_SEDFL|nr:BT4734/BF3469 family protein [Sediminitomix flava]PWJ42232.1 VirE-like protein [Sediminitomix flava]